MSMQITFLSLSSEDAVESAEVGRIKDVNI
jgi:hypothetical protein